MSDQTPDQPTDGGAPLDDVRRDSAHVFEPHWTDSDPWAEDSAAVDSAGYGRESTARAIETSTADPSIGALWDELAAPGHARIEQRLAAMRAAERAKRTEKAPLPRPIERLEDVPLGRDGNYADWTRPVDQFRCISVGPGVTDRYDADGAFAYRTTTFHQLGATRLECTDFDGRRHRPDGPAFVDSSVREFWAHGEFLRREYWHEVSRNQPGEWRNELSSPKI